MRLVIHKIEAKRDDNVSDFNLAYFLSDRLELREVLQT